jgi:CBS domain-containing protein
MVPNMNDISPQTFNVLNALNPIDDQPDCPAVAEVMTVGAVAVPPWITVGAARRVAALKRVQQMMVEQDGRWLGTICSPDLDDAAERELVSARMRRPTTFVDPTTPAAQALRLLDRDGVDWLPVVAGALLVGLVTREALQRAVARARRPARLITRRRGGQPGPLDRSQPSAIGCG